MKKRSILLSMLLILTFVLGACGSGKDPFEGKWRGKLDVTKQFEDGIIAAYPELTEYVDFEDLTFYIDVTFKDGMITMTVDQASVENFKNNFADGMVGVEEGSLMLYLNAAGITLEEAVAESGMTEEEYIASMVSVLEVDKMKEAMTTVTDAALAGFAAVNGPYTFNEQTINIRYTEDQYEAVEYAFEGENLILIFRGESYSLRVECSK
ncbi:MAG: hypothetical protein IJ958_08355 [Agathobacter sp.]|nr:hypothetical protein [Agathobacter sp.]